jgi:ABC-type transport system substrate-binding protein
MEVGALISERAYPQTFDAMILNISWSTPEPQILTNLILNSQQDIVNGGFNFPSYINPEMDALLQQAGSSVDCSAEARAPFYYQIQQISHDEVAYDVISDSVIMAAFSNRIQNVESSNWGFSDIQTWTIAD